MIKLADDNEEFEHILQYELFSRRWIGWVPGDFLQEKVSNFMVRKVGRKFWRYKEIEKIIEDEDKMPNV